MKNKSNINRPIRNDGEIEDIASSKSLRTAMIFIAVSFAYILFSDGFLYRMHDSVGESVFKVINTLKGVAFVLLTGLLIFYLNYHPLKKLLSTNRGLTLIFENNPQPMLILDVEDLKIRSCNLAAEQFYGYSLKEMKQFRFTDICPGNSPKTVEQTIHNQLGGEPFNLQQERADGLKVNIQLFIEKIIHEERPAYMLAIYEEDTDKVRQQHELTERSERLRLLEAKATEICKADMPRLQFYERQIRDAFSKETSITSANAEQILKLLDQMKQETKRIQQKLDVSENT